MITDTTVAIVPAKLTTHDLSTLGAKLKKPEVKRFLSVSNVKPYHMYNTTDLLT